MAPEDGDGQVDERHVPIIARIDRPACRRPPAPSGPGQPVAAAGREDARLCGSRGRDQGDAMTPERLTGLDASFLYMETPTLHMHVAMVAVFDPSTVPDGYSFRRIRQMIVDRIPLVPGLPAPAGGGARCAWATRSGSTTPSSTSTTTSAGPPCPRRAACASWVTSRPTSPAASSIGTDPCGRCGWSRDSRTARSPWSPRCTTAPLTASRAPSCLGVLFDLEPDPPGRAQPCERQLDSRIPSGLRAGLAGPDGQHGPARSTWAAWSGGPTGRVAGVRQVRQSETAGKAALPLTAPRTSINVVGARPAARGLRRRQPGRRQEAQERHGHHGQRRGARHVRRRAAHLPAGRRRAPRHPPRVGGAGFGHPRGGRAEGLQQGVGHVRAAAGRARRSAGAAAGHSRGDQGGQGGAQGPRRHHAAELGRARHAQRVRRGRPPLHGDEAGRPAPPGGQPGHLQRARARTSPSTWAAARCWACSPSAR